MQFELNPHPSCQPKTVRSIDAEVERAAGGLSITYLLVGDIGSLVIPPRMEPARRDELWRTTCFELFLKDDGPAYAEFNFSPSREWAAYRFDSYRSGMQPLNLPDIQTDAEITAEGIRVRATMEFAHLLEQLRVSGVTERLIELFGMGLSAIVEENDGTKSYWALAHPEGPPDFHHEACFAATLPPIAHE